MQNNAFFNYNFVRIFLIFFLLFVGFTIPLFLVHAEVSVTEVAWMGTTTSQYEEWVELHNNGSDDVSLTGWKLFKTGGTALFSPTGTISAGSYYLICRATTTLTDPLGGTCNEKGTFGGSGLNNTNDQLILKDSSGAVKESIDASGGWPAGDASTKQTMQKQGSAWITAVSTPGSETVTASADPDPSPDPDPNPDPNPTPDPDPTPSDNELPPTKDPKEKIEKVQPDPAYKAHMVIPDFGTAGIAIPMKASVTDHGKTDYVSGRFEWSLGDGGSYRFIKNIPINHTYYYPGTYTVVMQYYSDRFRTDPDTIHKKTITVVPSDIEILGYSTNDGLQLKNNSTKEIALDDWIIQSNNQEFVFPKFTTIAKGATLSLSPKVLGITVSNESILLLNPSRETISGYSYHYKKTASDDIPDETFSDSPQPQSLVLNQNPTTAPIPQSKTVRDIWHQNKWYVIFGGVVGAIILAYLAFHLYAKPSEDPF